MPDADRLIDLTLREFVDRVASSDPTPGGGSAAALTGGVAAALVGMVARLTIGRPEYAVHDVEFRTILSRADRLQKQLLELVDADATSYQQLMAAIRSPKRTEQERADRDRATQQGWRHAIDIPLATAEASLQLINLAAQVREQGNRSAQGDAAVAALLAFAAMLGAVYDVRTNLRQLRDVRFGDEATARVAGLEASGEAALRRALGQEQES